MGVRINGILNLWKVLISFSEHFSYKSFRGFLTRCVSKGGQTGKSLFWWGQKINQIAKLIHKVRKHRVTFELLICVSVYTTSCKIFTVKIIYFLKQCSLVGRYKEYVMCFLWEWNWCFLKHMHFFKITALLLCVCFSPHSYFWQIFIKFFLVLCFIGLHPNTHFFSIPQSVLPIRQIPKLWWKTTAPFA